MQVPSATSPAAPDPFSTFTATPIGGQPPLPVPGVTGLVSQPGASAPPPFSGDPLNPIPLGGVPMGVGGALPPGVQSGQPGAAAAQGGADYQPWMQQAGPDASRFRKIPTAGGLVRPSLDSSRAY